MAIEKDQAFLEKFGKQVKKLRLEKGFSLRGFADMINIENRQLIRIEKAELNTSLLMANAIAKGLGVPIAELFNFEVEENS